MILLEFLHYFLEIVLFVQNFLLSFKYVVLGEAPAHVCVGWSEVAGVCWKYGAHLGSADRGSGLALVVAGFTTKRNIALTNCPRFAHALVLAPARRNDGTKRFFRTSSYFLIEVLVQLVIILGKLWKGRLIEPTVVRVTRSFIRCASSRPSWSTFGGCLGLLHFLLFPDSLEVTQSHRCTI